MAGEKLTAVVTVHLHQGDPIRAHVEADEAKLLGLGDDIERSLERNAIALSVDGKLLLIPQSSIKFVEIDPAPPDLPLWVVRGRRL